MVGVVQLVEHQVVILGVAGSSPVTHPIEAREPVSARRPAFLSFEASSSSYDPGLPERVEEPILTQVDARRESAEVLWKLWKKGMP